MPFRLQCLAKQSVKPGWWNSIDLGTKFTMIMKRCLRTKPRSRVGTNRNTRRLTFSGRCLVWNSVSSISISLTIFISVLRTPLNPQRQRGLQWSLSLIGCSNRELQRHSLCITVDPNSKKYKFAALSTIGTSDTR
jgi:hypothetical protein